MICRGGVVAQEWGKSEVSCAEGTPGRIASWYWPGLLAVVGVLAVVMFGLASSVRVPPLIESDYAHQLLSADRAFDGLGFTSLPPVAPRQPWTYRQDWAFLTRWPVGYSALLVLIRHIADVPTLVACRILGAIACAAAVVFWFAFMLRLVPRGVIGLAAGALVALGSVSVGYLLNPSTDILLIAAVPAVLLLVDRQGAPTIAATSKGRAFSCIAWLAIGLLAGGVVWIRYAALFLPAAIAVRLLADVRKDVWRLWAAPVGFALGAMVPVVLLVMVNRAWGIDSSLAETVNLGASAGWRPSGRTLALALWNLTAIAPFAHTALARVLVVVAAAAALAIVWRSRRIGKQVNQHGGASLGHATHGDAASGCGAARHVGHATQRGATPSCVGASGCTTARLALVVVAALVLEVVAASTLFADKYDFVSLPRYFAAVTPLVLGLIIAGLASTRIPLARLTIITGLLLAIGWQGATGGVQQWSRATARTFEETRYGQRAVCFSPAASRVYDWVLAQRPDEFVIFSNFPDYIALETGLPVLPLPTSREQLHEWATRAGAARGIQPRIALVIDPDFRWRAQYYPSLRDIVVALDLHPLRGAPTLPSAIIFEPTPSPQDTYNPGNS